MKVIIDIPDEFIAHYKQDKFSDSLQRVLNDIIQYRHEHSFTLSGRYEDETLLMLIDVFSNSEKAKSKKQMSARAYNKGYEDGLEYAENNPSIKPNY